MCMLYSISTSATISSITDFAVIAAASTATVTPPIFSKELIYFLISGVGYADGIVKFTSNTRAVKIQILFFDFPRPEKLHCTSSDVY